MTSATGSQVLTGPFLEKDLPDYQAATQHYKAQWKRFLSPLQQDIIEFIIDATARFGSAKAYITTARFFAGDDPNPAKGYAGIAPITPVSENAYYSAKQELIRLGLITKRGLAYTVNYSIDAMTLATDDDVQKRVVAANRRGGILSTIEGILRWAAEAVDRLVAVEPEETDPTYTLGTSNTQSLKDKSFNKPPCNFVTRVKDYLMGKTTKDAILSGVLAATDFKRKALAGKRRARQTLPDLCNLFEAAWAAGQKEANPGTPVSKLLSRDRALLKSRILKPFQDAGVNSEHFSHWVAQHWQAIGAQHFKKSKNYPQTPVFRWLVACIDTYVTAYENREYLDASGKIDNFAAAKAEKAVERITDKAKEHTSELGKKMLIMQAEIDVLMKENNDLRNEAGIDAADDPDYGDVVKQARKTITIGNFDDPEPTKKKRRKLKRKSK